MDKDANGNWLLNFGPAGTSGNEELERSWLVAAQHIFQVFCLKQLDYGPGNIAKGGEIGVAIRCRDKISRLENLANKDPEYEPIEDTWVDLADYGIIGYMVHRGWWPKVAAPDLSCPFCGGVIK